MSLERSQVETTALRDGLESAAAEERAIETLRLVAARQDELGDAARLDPVRDSHLRNAALARAYLRDIFEPANDASHMSEDFIMLNLGIAQRAARYFHPKLHKLCQIIVIPKQPTEKGAERAFPPEGDAQWYRDAHALLAPIEARLRAWGEDFAGEPDCKLFRLAVSLGQMASEDGEIVVQREGGMFEIGRSDLWDPRWIAPLLEVDEPGWVGPFETKFGVHFVRVLEILPDTTVAPSTANFEERLAAESGPYREIGLGEWRGVEALPNHLRDLRTRHLVRLAGPSGGPPQ